MSGTHIVENTNISRTTAWGGGGPRPPRAAGELDSLVFLDDVYKL